MTKNYNLLKKFIASNLYSRYKGILSLSNISFLLIDVEGNILLELNPAPDFCKYVCQKHKGKVCSDYILHMKQTGEQDFVCKYGLENTIFPIVVKDETIGYITGMQIYSTETEFRKYMIDISELTNNEDIDSSFIAKSISAIRTIEKNKIEIHKQICVHISKNISLDLSKEAVNSNNDITKLSIEKEMLEKKILDLEAKNMSLVVNPHFLFNTLNSIARIAYFEGSHTTEELIYCLSDLLRYNLKNEELLHTIESEIDNIMKYFYIQKVRFKNRLEYEIEVSDDILPYRIPNMILQPIVENALIHGISPKRDGGKISIYAEKYKQDISIFVMDNGNGFPEGVLQNIYKHKKGLGFLSTDKRLKQYFGEKYGLKIIKSDCSGSTIAITIPTQIYAR